MVLEAVVGADQTAADRATTVSISKGNTAAEPIASTAVETSSAAMAAAGPNLLSGSIISGVKR